MDSSTYQSSAIHKPGILSLNTVPQDRLDIAEGDVHIWVIDLDVPTDQTVVWELLSPDEILRANRLIDAQKRRQFAASRSAARKILSAYTGIAPKQIEFDYSDHGKPFLLNNPVNFNLSHTEQTMLLAVTNHINIGIDIEKIAPITNHISIANTYFTRKDAFLLYQCDSENQLTMFYRLWTLKEAHCKCSGLGLSKSPVINFFDYLNMNVNVSPHARQFQIDNVRMVSFILPGNIAVGLAVQSQKNPHMRFFPHPQFDKLDRFREQIAPINHNCPVGIRVKQS